MRAGDEAFKDEGLVDGALNIRKTKMREDVCRLVETVARETERNGLCLQGIELGAHRCANANCCALWVYKVPGLVAVYTMRLRWLQ